MRHAATRAAPAFVASLALAGGLLAQPAPTGPTLTAGDVSMKLGFLLQPSFELQQIRGGDGDGGTAQNYYLRRARLNLSGHVSERVFFFLQTENAKLGYTTDGRKTISTGFQLLDAVVEWRIAKPFNLWGGLIYVPASREALKSSASEFAIDFVSYTFKETNALGGTSGRDTGFLARGYFLEDRLEYRVGVFSGYRAPSARNDPRVVARLQYNVFDTEVYNLPAYPGSYLGGKKVLAIGCAFDTQADYKGTSVDAFWDVPVRFGSFVGTATFVHLGASTEIPTALPHSTTFEVEAGVYLKRVRLGPWVRYQERDFAAATGVDEAAYLVGIGWFVQGHNLSFKAAYGKMDYASGRDPSVFRLQMQGYF